MNKYYIACFAIGLSNITFAETQTHDTLLGQCQSATQTMPQQQHRQMMPPRFTPPPMPQWVKQRMAQQRNMQQYRPMPRANFRAPQNQTRRTFERPPMVRRFNQAPARPMMRLAPARPVYYNRPRYNNNRGWTNNNMNGYGRGNGHTQMQNNYRGNGQGNGNGNGYGDGSADASGNFNMNFSGKGKSHARGRGRAQGDGNMQNNYRGNGFYQGQSFYQGRTQQQITTNQPPRQIIVPAPVVKVPVVQAAPNNFEIITPPIENTPIIDSDQDSVVDVADLCPNSTAGIKVNVFGCEAAVSIVLRGVNFKTNSDELTPDSTAILDPVVATLIANPRLHLEIAGHTDSDGDAAYNKDLSQRRARMVLNYLQAHQVDISTMKAAGYGEEYPIANNNTSAGKAMNRRVEVRRL